MKKPCFKSFILLPLLFVLLFSSCQPNPDHEIVVGKGNSNENAQQQAAATPYQATQHWKEDAPITLNDLTVTIDADVSMPSAEKYPVIRVKDKVFTQEEADKIIAVLSQGKQLYSNEATREELEQSLIALKAEVSRLKQEDPQSDLITVYEDYQIPDIEKRLQEMPKEDVKKEPVTVFQMSKYGWDQIAVRADLGKMELAAIAMNNGSNTLLESGYSIPSSSILFSDGAAYTAYNSDKHEVMAEDSAPEGVATTKEEATAQAQAMLDKLGITDMRIAQIRPAYRIIPYSTGVIEDKQSWQIVYTPQIEGIPVNFYKDNAAGVTNGGMSGKGYNAEYFNPIIVFYVDDTGIAMMRWLGPLEAGDKLNENAKLLAFPDIQQRIKDQLSKKYAYPAGKTKTTQVHITDIRLGYMRARVKDTQNDYMLIPVWDVNGYTDQTSMDGKAKINPENFIETLLTFNAMDGSVIDRRLGY